MEGLDDVLRYDLSPFCRKMEPAHEAYLRCVASLMHPEAPDPMGAFSLKCTNLAEAASAPHACSLPELEHLQHVQLIPARSAAVIGCGLV